MIATGRGQYPTSVHYLKIPRNEQNQRPVMAMKALQPLRGCCMTIFITIAMAIAIILTITMTSTVFVRISSTVTIQITVAMAITLTSTSTIVLIGPKVECH